MKEVNRFFKQKICIPYIFNIVIGLIVMAISLMFLKTYYLAWLTLLGGFAYFLIPLLVYMKNLHKLKKFFANEEERTISEYKMIDTSVLTAQCIYSYSLDRMTKMNYQNILTVQHIDNIFEKARPGYRGNHKIVIKDSTQVIQITVQNEAIAETIMNFIATKNPDVTLLNFHKEISKVYLNDLQNWQVSSRF
ncbi:MAG: hypothetical protein HFE67_08955 [Erysipelotrichaceae bacterium]|nr:hypothetical protein [Erysipelotrichaceae bacterium]